MGKPYHIIFDSKAAIHSVEFNTEKMHRIVQLVLLLVVLPVGLHAQNPVVGAYASATGLFSTEASTRFVGGEVGVWVPYFGLYRTSSDGRPPGMTSAIRLGIGGGQVASSVWVMSLHPEIGLGWARTVALVGPVLSVQDGGVHLGFRLSSGYHISEHVTFGVHLVEWSFFDPVYLGGQLTYTF